MSKIAEKKALEAYPIVIGEYSDNCNEYDVNEGDRLTYIEGYDQAMKDFMEMACDYLQKNLWRVVIEDGEFRQRFVTDFKKHMQDE